MPLRLRLLVAGVTGSGALLLAALVPALLGSDVPDAWRLALTGLAFIVGDIALLHLRFGTHRYSFTWGEFAVVLGLVLLPLPWLAACATLAVLPAHALNRLSPIKVAFNTLSYATGVTLASGFLQLTGGPVEEVIAQPATWLRLLVAATIYFLWNTITVSAAVALSQDVAFRTVVAKGLLLKVLVLIGNTLCATVVMAMVALQPTTVFLVPAFLAVLYLVYRNYLRAMQERDTWQVLQATSRELLRTEGGEVADVVLEHTKALCNADFVELLLVGEADSAAVVYRQRVDGERVRLEDTVESLCGAFWGRAVCEREPFEIHRRSAPALQQDDLQAHGIEHCVVAPLLVQDECLGVLRIGFSTETSFHRRDRQVFTTFANHVAGAVHNTRLFAEVRTRALHDPLTGLPNRALLSDRLTHAQARTRRSGGGVAVLFLDLDRFKVINDSLGHSVGDRLLQAVAERLAGTIRPGDTAGRFGGDEFIVVCEDVTDESEALRLAERLVSTLELPFTVTAAADPIFLSASIGVALSTDGAEDPAAMIRDADAAMYRAKERGRSRCEVFDQEMRERAVSRLETETDLRRALERSELRLEYQVFVDVPTQTIVGAEALVRWDHPRRGTLGPAEFIALAEETGLIRPLGAWVLHEACGQLARWAREDGWPPSFLLSVNLSPHQLADPSLLADVTAALASSGIDPQMLCLEITEGALVADMDHALDVLERLRALGVQVALDDFGTGYSSFSYLHRLPVDVLKIDRSFVDRLTVEPRDRAVVAGMIDLARALGLRTVAEGVETPGQLAELGALGCDLAQGFYFSAAREPAYVATEARAASLPMAAASD